MAFECFDEKSCFDFPNFDGFVPGGGDEVFPVRGEFYPANVMLMSTSDSLNSSFTFY